MISITDSEYNPSESWLRICGKERLDLQKDIELSVAARIQAGQYRQSDVSYISKVELQLVNRSLDVNQKQLERLRVLCRLWNVDLQTIQFESHRPIIGKAIVAFKRVLFPIVRIFLRDTIRQQREFNAQVVTAIAEIMNQGKDSEDNLSF